jgi:3-oxoacyl-[acyl-carrier-protein] synthase II
VQAIEAALDDARMTPGDIVAINAHGTATDVGDRVEAESIASVFGRGSQGPPASSTKAAHGHLLGASGAIELAASLVTVRSGWVPPTHNLQEPDPGCAINLVRSRPLDLRRRGAVLSNSFAFGGSNVCLVLAPS